MSQSIPAEHLPSIVSKVRSGDLVIKRTETWGHARRRSRRGHVHGRSPGCAGNDLGDPDPDGCRFRSKVQVEGKADVRIPLIGGKIESAIADEVLRLIEKEQGFTQQWLGA